MNKKTKMAALMVCVCVLAFGMNVFADSVEYNITVTSSGTNQDPISKRVVRTGCTRNEFYVEPTYFNTDNASFFARSIELYGTTASNETYVENGDSTGTYDSTPLCNVYYFMSTRYGYSSTGTVNSKGKFTP